MRVDQALRCGIVREHRHPQARPVASRPRVQARKPSTPRTAHVRRAQCTIPSASHGRPHLPVTRPPSHGCISVSLDAIARHACARCRGQLGGEAGDLLHPEHAVHADPAQSGGRRPRYRRPWDRRYPPSDDASRSTSSAPVSPLRRSNCRFAASPGVGQRHRVGVAESSGPADPADPLARPVASGTRSQKWTGWAGGPPPTAIQFCGSSGHLGRLRTISNRARYAFSLLAPADPIPA